MNRSAPMRVVVVVVVVPSTWAAVSLFGSSICHQVCIQVGLYRLTWMQTWCWMLLPNKFPAAHALVVAAIVVVVVVVGSSSSSSSMGTWGDLCQMDFLTS